ncbi:hypothetical protein MJD09_19440, partial [bacterium]|nr:hypothetical protein [bacterium]
MAMKKKSKKKRQLEKVRYRTLFRLYRIYGRYYKRYWKIIFVAYTALLLTILVALLQPWPLKLILDYVILGQPLPQEAAFITTWLGADALILLLALVIAYVMIRAVDSIFSYIHKVGLATFGGMMITDIRKNVFSHLQRLSLTFHESARAGDLIYRLNSDIREIKTILVSVPQEIVQRLVLIITHLGLMLFLEWRLALLSFAVLPIIFYYQKRTGKGVQKATRAKREK